MSVNQCEGGFKMSEAQEEQEVAVEVSQEEVKKDKKPEPAPKKKKKSAEPKAKGGGAGGLFKKVTLFLIFVMLIGTLCVAGWAAINLSSVTESWGAGEVRSDGLSSVIRGEPFVVNLADRRSQHYAQIDYALVLAPGVKDARVRQRIPMIQERVTPYFLSRTASELATPEGFEQARRELAEAVRAIYSAAEVERIVVSQLVVQ